MKTKFLLLALAAGISSSASAAIVAAFDFQSSTTGVWFQDSNVNTTYLTPSVGLTPGTTNIYSGWGTSPVIDVNTGKSVTFDISVNDGYQMTLTSMTLVNPSAVGGTTATKNTLYTWAYRVDNGGGYGAWNVNVNALPSVPGGRPTLTFPEEVVVTEKIQFGFFAAGATTDGGRVSVVGSGTGDDLIVNGTVSAIPEPSSLLLGAVGSLALLRRRRA